MVDREIVERLLGLLEEYIDDLESVKGISFKEYKSAKQVRRFVERTLQIAIEACLDIGWHIISDEGLPEAENNREVFAVLADSKVIDMEIVSTLQNMASFRNLIVHDYAKIDDEIVYGILKKRIGDFRKFSKMIARYARR